LKWKKWAVPPTGSQVEYLECLGRGTIPHLPFQSKRSVGWHSLADQWTLQEVFKVPNHFHEICQTDVYVLMRGTFHMAINDPSGVCLSVATDDIVKHWEKACVLDKWAIDPT
jgi:hypothetical protein